MKLAGATVLITGAGNGMGRELVIGAIKAGAKVVAVDLDKKALATTKQLANADSENYYPLALDITDTRKVAALTFIARKKGHIVNTSSMGAYTPVPGQSLYGASKAALSALTAGLFSELVDTNVKVTTVFPGAIATNIAKNSGIDLKGMDTGSSKIKMTTPQKAAQIILAGIEKDKPRVFIGQDAKVMNLLTRLNPQYAARLIQKQMKDLLK